MKAAFPELEEWAGMWLEKIGGLFHLQRQRRKAWQPELPLPEQSAAFAAVQASLEAGLAELLDKARKEGQALIRRYTLLEALQPAGGETTATDLAQVVAQGKVLGSLAGHRDGLSVFLEDPRISMENNLSERLLRGPVISRWLSFGSGGPEGALAAGRLFSVLETAALSRLNPYSYVVDWLDACARDAGQAASDLSAWLPWELDQERKEELRAPPRWWSPSNGPPEAEAAPAGRQVPRAASHAAQACQPASLGHSLTLPNRSLSTDCEATLRRCTSHSPSYALPPVGPGNNGLLGSEYHP